MAMMLQKFHFTCARCGNVFDALEMASDFAYGEFLLRNSRNGELRSLDTFHDPVFDEVAALLRHVPSLKNAKDMQIAKVLHKVFGVCCDRDKDGGVFEIDGNPSCTSCGSNEISSWIGSDPPVLEERDVLPVTHRQWNGLSSIEKNNLLNRIVSQKERGKSRGKGHV